MQQHTNAQTQLLDKGRKNQKEVQNIIKLMTNIVSKLKSH